MTKLLAAALAAAALFLSSACGGGSDRPAASDISTALQSDDNLLGTTLPTKAADCVAKALESSKLSDRTLQAVIDNDAAAVPNSEDILLGDLAKELSDCVAR